MEQVLQYTCINVGGSRGKVKLGMGAKLQDWSQYRHEQTQSTIIAVRLGLTHQGSALFAASMRFTIPFLSLLLVAGIASGADERPNIVLILSDDQAWTDYSFMGHEHIETPHLDKLSERSSVFRRGYVPTALCLSLIHI